MKEGNFGVSSENDRNSELISPEQACPKRNSYDSVSVSDQQKMQRSTSMYYASNNKDSNDFSMKSGPNVVRQHSLIVNRSSSSSIPEATRISARPKPAPRQIDCMKRTVIAVDMPEVM